MKCKVLMTLLKMHLHNIHIGLSLTMQWSITIIVNIITAFSPPSSYTKARAIGVVMWSQQALEYINKISFETTHDSYSATP